MKKILSLLGIVLLANLSAKSIYIQVLSVYNEENLFNISYRLNELGYSMNVSQKDGLYRVYTGPFEDRYSASSALRDVRKKIARDAFIIEAEIKGSKLETTKTTLKSKKAKKKKVVIAPIKAKVEQQSVQVLVTKDGKVSAIKVEDKNTKKSRDNNFFVGVNVGVSKFDLERVNVTLSSVGYTYGLVAGYYFTPNIYMTLNYERSQLQGVYLDTFATSLNYKLNPIFLISPYVGIIGGLNVLSWESTTYKDDVQSAFVPGLELGFEVPVSDNASIVMFGKYMMLDYKAVSESSTQRTVKFNNEISASVGYRYNF